MKSIYNATDRKLATLEVIGALIIIGFWIGWYLDILKSIDASNPLYDTYIVFESSFPLPDLWIVILLFISAYGIWKQRVFGIYTGIAAGGGLVFLGLIDTSFYIQHNLYQYDVLLLPINIACIGGGLLLIARFGTTIKERLIQVDRN
ncbi:MAG: hypothetical protein ACXABU_17940 [Candidatus Hodarchaeales archaeon]|jgi:hypothetical protein